MNGYGHYRLSVTGLISHWPVALLLGYSSATLVQRNFDALDHFLNKVSKKLLQWSILTC